MGAKQPFPISFACCEIASAPRNDEIKECDCDALFTLTLVLSRQERGDCSFKKALFLLQLSAEQ